MDGSLKGATISSKGEPGNNKDAFHTLDLQNWNLTIRCFLVSWPGDSIRVDPYPTAAPLTTACQRIVFIQKSLCVYFQIKNVSSTSKRNR